MATAYDPTSRPAGLPRAPFSEPLNDAVHWWEGMLLAPQHLQQGDLYWQQQLRYRLAQLTPCYWGVAELALDELKLVDGIVKIDRLEAVMPDGTPVVYPGTYEGVALELDLAPQLSQPGAALRVALLMPRRLPNGSDVSLPRHEVVKGEDVVDENTGDSAVPVDRLRPRIRLWAGGDIPAQYQACPLLELQRRVDAQRYELAAYHPPLLRWGAAEFLGGQGLPQRMRTLNKALWLKLRELGGDRRDDGPEDASLLGGDLARQLDMARRLAAVLPRFGLMAARPEAAALSVYDTLAEVAGAMAAFGANPIVPMFDVYRHDDCEPQFRRALDYIERKLGYIDTRHELLAFERVAPGRFRRALGAHAGHELIVELRAAGSGPLSDAERQAFKDWLSEACIAVEPLHPAVRKARDSAQVHLLSAEDCARRQLRAGAAMFLIQNEHLGLPDNALHALLAPGQPLVIEGQAGGAEPALILLVQPHAPAARGAPPAKRSVTDVPVLGDVHA